MYNQNSKFFTKNANHFGFTRDYTSRRNSIFLQINQVGNLKAKSINKKIESFCLRKFYQCECSIHLAPRMFVSSQTLTYTVLRCGRCLKGYKEA